MKSKVLNFLAFSSTAALIVSALVALSFGFSNDNHYSPPPSPQTTTRAAAEMLQLLPPETALVGDRNRKSLMLKRVELIPVKGAFGAESFSFDPQGQGPYTGVSDGRILKWLPSQRKWVDFAFVSRDREKCLGTRMEDHEELEHICGRPLGLGFNNNTGDLYIADAYLGLLKVGSEGGSVTQVHGPESGFTLRFTNGLDIDQHTGLVYFTDSSSHHSRRNYISVILTDDRTGRLLKYDPETERTQVLLDSLAFPNGVALSRDGESILVAETSSCSVLQFCLRTKTYRIFARLPGFPDNIKRSPRGGYWVGIYTRKTQLLDWIMSIPGVGKVVPLMISEHHIRKMNGVYGKWKGRGMGMRLSEEGEVLEVVEGGIEVGKTTGNEESIGIGKEWKSISEVNERSCNRVWIGSVNVPFVGVYEILN